MGAQLRGPGGQVGAGLRALEAAVALAQGLHAVALTGWEDGAGLMVMLNNSVKIFISSVTLQFSVWMI